MDTEESNILSHNYVNILERIKVSDDFISLKLLEEIKNCKRKEKNIIALQISAQREIYEASIYNPNIEGNLNDEDLEDKRRTEQNKKIKISDTLSKYKSCSDILQNAVFQTQIQNNFYQSLHDETPENNETIRSTLINYQTNLELNSKLSKLCEETDEFENKIFDLRLKNRRSLKTINDKWKILNGQNSTKHSEETGKLGVKLQKRQKRIDLLVGLLQNLISGSGEIWGINNRLMNILLLCDLATNRSYGCEATRDVLKNLENSSNTEK